MYELIEGINIPISDYYRRLTDEEKSKRFSEDFQGDSFYYDKYDALITISYNNDVELNNKNVIGRIKYIEESVSKIYEEYSLIECSSKMIDDERRLAVLLFYSKRNDDYRYTLISTTNINGKELLICFDCRALDTFYLTDDIFKMLEGVVY